MVELVKLLNCGFGTLGNAIEFDVAVIKDIAPTITIETSTGQKETIDANHLSTSDLGDYTVYHYPKNILDGTVTFTKEDLVLIRVELPEEAVQNYFA